MRRPLKLGGWLALLLLVLAGGIVLPNAFDERLLSDAAAAMQDKPEQVTPGDNMFYAMMGSGSAAVDPWQAGWNRLQYAVAASKQGKSGVELDPARGPRMEIVDRGRLPVLGDLAATVEWVRGDPAAAVKLLDSNQSFIARYQALDHYPRYVSELPPALLASVLPDWQVPGNAARLQQIQFAQLLIAGHSDDTAEHLRQDTRFWRRLTAEKQLSLIDKMVALAHLRADFRMASWLLHAYPPDASMIAAFEDMVRPITPQERSMTGAYGNEFRWQAEELLRDPQETLLPDPSAKEQSWLDRLPAWSKRQLFLPNATMNDLYRGYTAALEADSQPCSKPRTVVDPPAEWLGLRNYYGRRGVAGLWQGELDYSTRMCDLEGVQRLLALQLRMRTQNVAEEQAAEFVRSAGPDYADPFTGGPMQWNADSKSLAFQAHDKRGMLPWPI